MMVFTSISQESKIYRQGELLSKDRFEMFGGADMFFYGKETIVEEFGLYDLVDIMKVRGITLFIIPSVPSVSNRPIIAR